MVGLASATPGLTGAHIACLCQRADMFLSNLDLVPESLTLLRTQTF
jgi:hypothetical protein